MAFGLLAWFLIVSVGAYDTVEMVQTKYSGGGTPQERSGETEGPTQRLIHEVVDAAEERIRHGADRYAVAGEAAHAAADAVKQLDALDGERPDGVVDDEIAAAKEVVAELYADDSKIQAGEPFTVVYSNDCPSGFERITSREGCTEFLHSAVCTNYEKWPEFTNQNMAGVPCQSNDGNVARDSGLPGWSNLPRGCTLDGSKKVALNQHPTGDAAGHVYLVCEAATTITTTAEPFTVVYSNDCPSGFERITSREGCTAFLHSEVCTNYEKWPEFTNQNMAGVPCQSNDGYMARDSGLPGWSNLPRGCTLDGSKKVALNQHPTGDAAGHVYLVCEAATTAAAAAAEPFTVVYANDCPPGYERITSREECTEFLHSEVCTNYEKWPEFTNQNMAGVPCQSNDGNVARDSGLPGWSNLPRGCTLDGSKKVALNQHPAGEAAGHVYLVCKAVATPA